MKVLLATGVVSSPQPGQGAVAAGEVVGFDAHLLEHRDIEIGEGGVVPRVEGEMLSVLEAAAGQQDGQVAWVVCICVPQITSQ